MSGHRKPRSVAYTSQMFAETTPEASSSLTNVKKWASAAGYAIDKILGLTSDMVTEEKGRFRALYLSDGTYVIAGVASRTLSVKYPTLPHAPPSPRLYIDRCINESQTILTSLQFLKTY